MLQHYYCFFFVFFYFIISYHLFLKGKTQKKQLEMNEDHPPPTPVSHRWAAQFVFNTSQCRRKLVSVQKWISPEPFRPENWILASPRFKETTDPKFNHLNPFHHQCLPPVGELPALTLSTQSDAAWSSPSVGFTSTADTNSDRPTKKKSCVLRAVCAFGSLVYEQSGRDADNQHISESEDGNPSLSLSLSLSFSKWLYSVM